MRRCRSFMWRLIMSIFLIASLAASLSPASADLVAHWAMDEDSWDQVSYDVLDSSGNNNHGRAYNGATTVADGRLGRAGDFEHSYVEVPQNSATGFLDLDSDGTVSCWVNFDDLQLPNATHRILGTPSYHHGILFNQYGTSFPAYWTSYTGGSQKWVSDAFAEEQWFHLAVANVDGTIRVYVDGQLQGSTATQGTNTFDEQKLFIGGPASWDIDGRIDDVAIWSEGLDEARVRSLYTVPEDLELSYNASDLIALWDLYDAEVSGAIKGVPWRFADSLPDLPGGGTPAPGDAYMSDGVMYLAMDGGTGLAAVPEPLSLTLAAFGLLCMAVWRRRRIR